MKNLVYLLTVSLIFGCTNSYEKKALESDFFTFQWLDQHVLETSKLNGELSQFVQSSSELRALVSNILDTISKQEKYLITKTGGYKSGYEDNLAFLANRNLNSLVELNRNNPYNITIEYLNRITNYLEFHGFKSYPIALKLSDHPYWKHSPEIENLDYFDVAFDVQSIYQALIFWNKVKIDILLLERQFLQHHLKIQVN